MSIFGALYTYRAFIARGAWDELQKRYAGSGLGVVWNILVPLAQIAIYVFVFSTIAGSRVISSGVGPGTFPFVLFLCTGMLPWLSFADSIAQGTGALVRNAPYLQKMALPEAIFIAQSALVSLITGSISLTLLVAAGALLGLTVGWAYLLIPLVLLLFQALSFGFALTTAALNVLFRDVGYAVSVFLPMWMWLTPIVYSETLLPPPTRALLHWNPVYGFISAFREIFLHNQAPPPTLWAMMLGWVALALAVGVLVLSRLRADIRDVL